ncbi:hypothetical protein PHYSODRAFT_340595 [Phytophthora sojae]|uniref:Uncharacterized protein n=1 Tax=Phytophthora sojae (strain P6497) TaxID=1094619 RepID=G5AA86_PHYSP|nr:hypothetical protein PHYSODRAFT_340595 [Phytophthora sojae]EGZ07515.1 hypothetical protein PHYSODRAFT_340595 [Phytophthora sojae]|eukprot:XP_009537081.1 hypothetical protein PHYSODRAFT_340595 [Phytophthora sojae]
MAGAKKGPMKKSDKCKTMMMPTDVEQANEGMTKGVGRKYIFTEPRPLKVRETDHARVQKVQPAPKRKEIPVDVAVLQRLNINKPKANEDLPKARAGKDQPKDEDEDEPMAGDTASGSEDDIDEFDGKTVVPANSV